jgi:hypothetical protein
MKYFTPLLLLAFAAGGVVAQPNAAERRFIHEGMSEAEVVQKIGRPHYKSATPHHGGRRGKQGKQGKVWTYPPAPDDPQTTTLVTIANGQVERVERRVTY